MIKTLHRLHQNKTRIARVLLVLFMLAWVNLVYQAPIHAAMKSSHQIPCNCFVGLCDTVLGLQDQSDEGVNLVVPVVTGIAMVFQIQPAITQSSSVSLHQQRVELAFQQSRPPPLSRTGILRI